MNNKTTTIRPISLRNVNRKGIKYLAQGVTKRLLEKYKPGQYILINETVKNRQDQRKVT